MYRFRDTSIRIKVLVAPLIMIITLAVILFIAVSGMENQRQALSHVQEISLHRLKLVQEFITTSEQVQSDVYRLSVLQFMRSDEAEVLPVSERLKAGLNNLTVINGEILTKLSLDQYEEKLLQELYTSLNAFRHQVQQAIMAVSENPSFGVLLVRSAAIPFSELSSMLSRLLEHQNARIWAAEKESEESLARIQRSIFTIAALMALSAIFLTFAIGSRFISQPILELTRLTGRLTEGDLSVRVTAGGRRDEIGQLEKALTVFRETAIDKARADRKLLESEERFRNLYNNALVGLFRTRIKDGAPLQVNRYYAELAGYATVEECLADFVSSKHYADPALRPQILEQLRRDGEVRNMEAEIIHRDNRPVWINFSARIFPDQGCIEGSLVDISDRKEAQEKLLASLHEKEVLLREIHHRVKNNMQMIQSLISLQANEIEEPAHRRPLINTSNRIRSMALVHEILYKSEDLNKLDLDMDSYFRDLANHLVRIYHDADLALGLDLDIEPVPLDLDMSIACGLIVNELLTNSLKYAFAGRTEGRIRISLKKAGPKEATLVVSDDGVGLPGGAEFKPVDSLGTRLVRILAEDQLKGTVSVAHDKGVSYRIQFPTGA